MGIIKVLNNKSDIQTHLKSLTVMPFDRQYMCSYLSSMVIMSLSCTVSEILSLISQTLKTSRDHAYAHSRDSL